MTGSAHTLQLSLSLLSELCLVLAAAIAYVPFVRLSRLRGGPFRISSYAVASPLCPAIIRSIL